ncbi:TPA: glycosyltransferase [Providencia alcalifaciens]
MKVLLIIPTYYPAIKYGGPIFSTLYTSIELNKLENIELSVATTNANKDEKLSVPTEKWVNVKNIKVKYYNEIIRNKFSLSLFFKIWKDIKTHDIIHIQAIFNTPIPISLFYSWLLKKPIVLSPRGSLGTWCLSNGLGFFIKKIWLKIFIRPFSNRVTWHATSIQEKKEIHQIFPHAKIKIIPNGIDLEEYAKEPSISQKDWYEKHNISGDDNIIISMGRIEEKKGFDILIKSFNHLLKEKPNSTLLIAGPDYGFQKNLLKLVKELNLIEKVKFTGTLSGDDKLAFFKYANVFVLPSHNENFGNVYLESLASGTPIIASKNTPWSTIENAHCGLWVENTPEKTAEATISLLNDNMENLRKNSIAFSKKFSWTEVANEFENLFSSLRNNK